MERHRHATRCSKLELDRARDNRRNAIGYNNVGNPQCIVFGHATEDWTVYYQRQLACTIVFGANSLTATQITQGLGNCPIGYVRTVMVDYLASAFS